MDLCEQVCHLKARFGAALLDGDDNADQLEVLAGLLRGRGEGLQLDRLTGIFGAGSSNSQGSGSVEAPSVVMARELAVPAAGGTSPRRLAASAAPVPQEDARAPPPPNPPGLEAARLGEVMGKMLETQQQLVDRVAATARPERRSVIQVRPHSQCPVLADGDHAVEAFFDVCEETRTRTND